MNPVQQRIEAAVRALHSDILRTLMLDHTASVVTVVSMNGKSTGQWVLGGANHEPDVIAARLRVCADALEKNGGSAA